MPPDAAVAEVSLLGFTVGITADRRWEEQAELLKRRGATIIHGPSIRTLPLGSTDILRAVTEQLIARPPSLIVANTGIGMRTWFSASESWGLGDDLLTAISAAKVFARGPKASSAMHQAGLEIAGLSPSEQMAELLDLLLARNLAGERIAFQCHGDESPDVVARLRSAGAEVVEVPVYRWILPDETTAAENLIRATIDRSVHALTFTSAPAVRNIMTIAEDIDASEQFLDAINSDVLTVMVGPVCAEAARILGFNTPITPAKWRLGPMIRTLSDSLLATRLQITMAGLPVLISGTSLVFEGRSIALSRRETDVLRTLVTRSPGYTTKRELHLRIWGGAGDDHVVEVTVGRLRRKLGIPGSAIITTARRGYSLRP